MPGRTANKERNKLRVKWNFNWCANDAYAAWGSTLTPPTSHLPYTIRYATRLPFRMPRRSHFNKSLQCPLKNISIIKARQQNRRVKGDLREKGGGGRSSVCPGTRSCWGEEVEDVGESIGTFTHKIVDWIYGSNKRQDTTTTTTPRMLLRMRIREWGESTT